MRLIGVLLVLVIATALGVMIKQDPGYALFAYGDWTVEMPLWITAVILVIVISASVFGLWIIHTIFSSSRQIKAWWHRHKKQTARLHTAKGLLELTEGRWLEAEKRLTLGARYSDAPIINYLSAAKAAEEAGAVDRRDRYLQLAAYHASKGSEIAVRLTQAQLQFKHGELAQSIETLESLYAEKPKHPQVLKLLCSIYEATQDWYALYKLLPDIRKANIFPDKETLNAFQQKVYLALLPTIAQDGLPALMKFWKKAPDTVQQHPRCLTTYAALLIQFQAEDETEALLRNFLKKHWDTEAIRLYGIVNIASPKKQLNFAEALLEKNPEDPTLFLTLGRLCFRNQLWGKARHYLELSLKLDPMPETYALLGQVMDHLGDPTLRDEYYRKGLFAVTDWQTRPLSLPEKMS